MFNYSKPKYFAFFSEQFKKLKPSKCCRYNQNGIPLTSLQVKTLFQESSNLLTGWRTTDTRLFKDYYSEDYQGAIEFIREVARIDGLSTKNCPGFHYLGGELLTLELYSNSLNGLSQVDFELAMRINQIDERKYFLIVLNGQANYRQQVAAFRMRVQSRKIEEELRQQLQQKQ